MAVALISQPVLAANNAPNFRQRLESLLNELRVATDALPVVPGAAVPIDSAKLYALRGVVSALTIEVRQRLKWNGAL